jgi:protein-S-isoprenylcysteine O-methyltransferase Ste14
VKPRVPPPIVILLAATFMWALSRRRPLAHRFGPPWNRVGVIPGAAGAALDGAAFRRFRVLRTTVNPMQPGNATRLVTDSAFRISRNPICLGLLRLGWALWLGSASRWFVPPLFVVTITLAQIVPEERARGRLLRHAAPRLPQQCGSVDRPPRHVAGRRDRVRAAGRT